MDDITRERVWRKLQVLPDEQLFQVMDYIEFLETKYASGKASAPTGLQRFAERLQDRLRGRSVAPEYISGAVGMLGMARKVVETGREVVTGVVQTGLGVLDEVAEAGKGFLTEAPTHPGDATLPAGVKPGSGPVAIPAASATAATAASASTGADAATDSSDVPAAATPGDAVPAPALETPQPPPGREAAGEEPPAL